MKKHSLLSLLKESEINVKDFFIFTKEIIEKIISSNINFKEDLSKSDLQYILENYYDSRFNFKKLLDEISSDDLIEDDVICFSAQELLVEISENNGSDRTMFVIKKFLTYHTMYQGAMKNSPYDKALQIIQNGNPEEITPFEESRPYESTAINREDAQETIDQKYTNPIYKAPKSKAQKQEFYDGCKVIMENSKLGHFVYPKTWDDEIFVDDQNFEFKKKDAYVVFKTEVPGMGDFAFHSGDWFLIGDKKTLDILIEFNKRNQKVTFYTTKFNNRKVEKLNVKRYKCGGTDKDVNSIPYHVEVIFQDVDIEKDVDEVARHYNISPSKIEKKEDELIKKLEITLDHKLNIERSEWALLTGKSGCGKSTLAINYAKKKNIDYVLMQGNAQLSQDDFLGYSSIIKTDKESTKKDLYVSSLLRDAVENGKIFILDEIDACNPNTLICLNSLKNKQFQFPDELIDIHPNFRFIATANTLDYSDVYNGRSKLDKATLARFKEIKSDLEEHHLALRYGLEHIKDIANIDRFEPREIERLVTEKIIEKEIGSAF